MDENLTKTEVRHGMGPRSMVSVLFVSMTLAIVVGAILIFYFYFTQSPA